MRANLVRKVHRDCGENVVPRAATHEKTRNGAMRGVVASVPARGPTDDLELVIVTVPDDITACVSQAPDHVQVTGCRGPVHRVGVVSLLAGVHVQAASQQEIHSRQVPIAGRVVQQRPLVRLDSDVQPVWMLVEQGGQDVSRRHCVRRSTSCPFTVSESTCALSARQLENPNCFASSNCASASLRVRVGLAQFCETTFRLLAEPIKIGVIGEGRECSTDLLSFEREQALSAPISAVWARTRRLWTNGGGRVEPFTRTVGRPRGTWPDGNAQRTVAQAKREAETGYESVTLFGRCSIGAVRT